MRYSAASNFKSTRQLKRQRGKNFKFLVLIIIVSLVFYFLYSPDKQPEKEVAGIEISSQQTEIPNPTASASPKAVRYKSLQEAIEKSLEGTTGSYGVFVKNIKTGESFSLNENKVFEAGSLYKLWTMAAVYKQIEAGNLDPEDELSQGIAVLNRKFGIDPALAEQTKGTITLTVDSALNQMITISHNYAALLLTEKVGLSKVAAFLDEKGFKNSKVGTDGSAPVTTPLDIALYFEKLQRGELGSTDSTAKMIDLLKKQKLNNKIPKNLPPELVIAHKTGELGWFSHDAGIIYSEKGDYIIVVMSESSIPKAAEERIADLSKNIYNYFLKI
jgi:beta-lactamase class A